MYISTLPRTVHTCDVCKCACTYVVILYTYLNVQCYLCMTHTVLLVVIRSRGIFWFCDEKYSCVGPYYTYVYTYAEIMLLCEFLIILLLRVEFLDVPSDSSTWDFTMCNLSRLPLSSQNILGPPHAGNTRSQCDCTTSGYSLLQKRHRTRMGSFQFHIRFPFHCRHCPQFLDGDHHA